MAKKYIERTISPLVLLYSKQYPVVTIMGPRQSGKTTLCRQLFQDKAYVSLETPEDRLFAQQDPVGFLGRYPDGAVLDEIQRVPDLLSYIQTIVDDREQNGMFILTGSQQFGLLDNISQSLAGRTALVDLLPFSLKEAWGQQLSDQDINTVLWTGGYPGIFDKGRNPSQMLQFYVRTYLERDVRTLINIKDLSAFEIFLRLCAGRTGQILNMSALGNECGVTGKTIREWISVLEASYILKLLKPYYANFNKRLVKSPKLYFLDIGLACYLLGISNPDHLVSHPLKGALFETMAVSEIWKQTCNRGEGDTLYYFRDSKGHEVDLIRDQGISQSIMEIKSGQTIAPDFFKGLDYYKKISSNVDQAFLVYGGDKNHIQNNTRVTGWRHLSDIGF
nr:ATP-binding protein [uncultured Desulfobacter sp.]